eukprot:5751490-Karenia_brevis.AAC.1
MKTGSLKDFISHHGNLATVNGDRIATAGRASPLIQDGKERDSLCVASSQFRGHASSDAIATTGMLR